MAERFSASVAGRHMACHASANLELAIPGWVPPVDDRTVDNAANRGTSMHELFAKVMELGAHDLDNMARAIAYIARLRKTRRFNVLIEQSIKATWLPGSPDTTVDLVLYTADEIHVIDLKTGRVRVEVVGNEQLLYYGVCFSPLAPRAKGVTLHIVQPWADNCESWFADTNELSAFMTKAQVTANKIAAGDVTFGPSDHCTFCPANPHARTVKGSPLCPALMQIYYPSVVDEDEILSL
jgi:Protein of unknown function (DUF2800)